MSDAVMFSQVWEMSWRGLHWWQMPGFDFETQKLNFSLFRRGLVDMEGMTVEARGVDGKMEQTRVAVSVMLTGKGRSRQSRPVRAVVRARQQVRLHPGAAVRVPRDGVRSDLCERQLALLSRYAAISASMSRANAPRAMLRAVCERLGMPGRRVDSGLDRRARWSAVECGAVAAGLAEMEMCQAELAAVQGQVARMYAVWIEGAVKRGRKQALMEAAKVSWQTIKTLESAPEMLCLSTLAALEAGLAVLGVREGAPKAPGSPTPATEEVGR